ncbi:hypothetical protein AQUCO_05300019v1 [Aquilegia coerulea]|uniref:C3H1-type domain-containing protein n=1 Tax=Aquilegia coerulea TaxID=218851 RepID=A0A2G5CHZ3_AQUCA|nr:hypothetical protein AQUCO_05300019v1 [Aquilegia coerulea]
MQSAAVSKPFLRKSERGLLGMYNPHFFPVPQPRIMNSSLYNKSEEFFMYTFKIRRCSKLRSHDWTECPFAHKGEKARRRDPHKYHYCAIICPLFRNGSCPRGDLCQFAHGIFEFWLHPARFRTRFCNSGPFCLRKVCFFAHSPKELRPNTGYKCQCHTRMNAPPARRTFPGNTSRRPMIPTYFPSTSTGSNRNQVQLPILPNYPSPSTNVGNKKKVEVTWEDVMEHFKVLNLEEHAGGAEEDQLGHILDAIDYSTVDWTAEIPDVDWVSDLVK